MDSFVSSQVQSSVPGPFRELSLNLYLSSNPEAALHGHSSEVAAHSGRQAGGHLDVGAGQPLRVSTPEAAAAELALLGPDCVRIATDGGGLETPGRSAGWGATATWHGRATTAVVARPARGGISRWCPRRSAACWWDFGAVVRRAALRFKGTRRLTK